MRRERANSPTGPKAQLESPDQATDDCALVHLKEVGERTWSIPGDDAMSGEGK